MEKLHVPFGFLVIGMNQIAINALMSLVPKFASDSLFSFSSVIIFKRLVVSLLCCFYYYFILFVINLFIFIPYSLLWVGVSILNMYFEYMLDYLVMKLMVQILFMKDVVVVHCFDGNILILESTEKTKQSKVGKQQPILQSRRSEAHQNY